MPNQTYEVRLSDGNSYEVTLDRPLAEGENIQDVVSDYEGSFAKQLPKGDAISPGDAKLLENAVRPQLKGISTTTQDTITNALKTAGRLGTYVGAGLVAPATIPAQALAGTAAFGTNVALGLEEPSLFGAATAAGAPALATGLAKGIQGSGSLLRKITPMTKSAAKEMLDISERVIAKGMVPEGLAKGLYSQFDKIADVRIPVGNYVRSLAETLANKQYTTEPGVRSLVTQLQKEMEDIKFGAPASFLQDKLIELGSKTGISPAKQEVGKRLQAAIWSDLRGAETELGKLQGVKGQTASKTAREATALLINANKVFRQESAVRELQDVAKQATGTTKSGYDYLNVGRILNYIKDTNKNQFFRESFPPRVLEDMENTFKRLNKAPREISLRTAELGLGATTGLIFFPQIVGGMAGQNTADTTRNAALVATLLVGSAMTPIGAKVLMKSLEHGPYLTRQQVMLLGSTLRAYNSETQGELDRVKEALSNKNITFEEKVKMAKDLPTRATALPEETL